MGSGEPWNCFKPQASRVALRRMGKPQKKGPHWGPLEQELVRAQSMAAKKSLLFTGSGFMVLSPGVQLAGQTSSG